MAQTRSLPGSTLHTDDCTITNTYRKSYSFLEGSMQAFLYNTVKNDSINRHILLVTTYSMIGGVEMLHITIDSAGVSNVKLVSKDSSVVSWKINLSDSSRDHLFEKSEPVGFYFGVCNFQNDHVIQTLVISDPVNNRWIEIIAMGIFLKDLLNKNKGFAYLADIVERLQYLKKPYIR